MFLRRRKEQLAAQSVIAVVEFDMQKILVVDMLGQLDRVRSRAAAERIVGERNTHPFPPETNIPPEWHIELETLAAELGYRTTKAAEIQREFANLVAAIAST